MSEEKPYIVKANVTTSMQTYHFDEECPFVQRMKGTRRRRKSYLEFHELEPCERCAKGKEVPDV